MHHKQDNRAVFEKAPFSELFTRMELPAKTTLLSEGEISKNVWFIEKGCIRAWFNNNGNDLTFQFFFENESISSIESYRTGQPSVFSIETLEPCIVHVIRKPDMERLLLESPEIKSALEDSIFQRLLFYQKLFLSRIRDNPRERYLDLLKNQPEIIRRIPQHYIASYLGITAVSLSRIRNKVKGLS